MFQQFFYLISEEFLSYSALNVLIKFLFYLIEMKSIIDFLTTRNRLSL